MPKEFFIFMGIGLLTAAISGGLAGLFYYLAVLNFLWYFTAIYAAIGFLTIALAFISYAMFRASIFGDTNVITDESRSF